MKKNNRGFTLAELLIVVAIIAVLVAIAIPIFTTQLEKSREYTDLANIRSAYAAGTVAAMNGKLADGTPLPATTNFNPGVDGSLGTAVNLGQGTATKGGVDVSAIQGYSSYTETTDAKGKPIVVTFSSGMLKSVNFGS